MSKLISLGVFALMLSIFSGQVFAGDAALCEPLKQDQNKSLYGLCVAWHHADENARDKIADKYFDRSGGFPVPGSEEPEPEQDFYCPCWDEVSFADICALGTPVQSFIASSFGLVTFEDLQFELFGTDSLSCAHVVQEASGTILFEDFNGGNPLTVDEGLDCRSEIEAIASLFSGGACD